MAKQLLSLLLLLALPFGMPQAQAQAQPASSFPIRKACRELMPQILYILGADQVTTIGPQYLFQKHLGGTDTIQIHADSMPAVFRAFTPHWLLRYDLKGGNVTLVNQANGVGVHLNSNTYLFRRFDLDHLREATPDRFLLEAVAAAFLYQTGTTESHQGERLPGSLMGVAFVYLPRLSAESFRLTKEFESNFCPTDDEVYEGAAAEVIPFGGINICYRKSRR